MMAGSLEKRGKQSDGGWKDIPTGPLLEIAQRLECFEDFEVLHLVCSRWTCSLRAAKFKFLGRKPQVPWLMLAQVEHHHQNDSSSSTPPFMMPCSSSSNGSGRRAKAQRLLFYSLWSRCVRPSLIRLPYQPGLNAEEGIGKCCCYSSNGWLLIVRRGMDMCLYSPFYAPPHNFVPLPGPCSLRLTICNTSTMWDGCVKRFVLSSNPINGSYTVMIAYDVDKVAIWRPGDDSWTPLGRCGCNVTNVFTELYNLLDVAFYQGHCYALDYLGIISRFIVPGQKAEASGELNINNDDHANQYMYMHWLHLTDVFPRGNHKYIWRGYFVVESPSKGNKGKLLVVLRQHLKPGYQPLVLPHDYLTVGFRVLELVVYPGSFWARLEEVKSLGNKSFFVGRNQALCIDMEQKAATTPNDSQADKGTSCYYGCKPNCIYFTDDRWDKFSIEKCGAGKDMGIYNMADGSIEHHFPGDALSDLSPVMWVDLPARKVLNNSRTAD